MWHGATLGAQTSTPIGTISTITLRASKSGRACGSAVDVLCDGGFERSFTSANPATNVTSPSGKSALATLLTLPPKLLPPLVGPHLEPCVLTEHCR